VACRWRARAAWDGGAAPWHPARPGTLPCLLVGAGPNPTPCSDKNLQVRTWLGGEATERIEEWRTVVYEAAGVVKAISVFKARRRCAGALQQQALRGWAWSPVTCEHMVARTWCGSAPGTALFAVGSCPFVMWHRAALVLQSRVGSEDHVEALRRQLRLDYRVGSGVLNPRSAATPAHTA